MAKYSDLIYGTGVLYGETGKIALSAEPMSAIAIDYGKIQVNYVIPSGDYVGFRIVRNQDSYPETEDDGAILVEKIPGVDAELTAVFLDSSDNVVAPLQLGRFAYYRAWILVATDSSWVRAGDAFTLSPLRNGINIGTDAVQSVYGGVNVTSDASIIHSYELSSTHRRFLDTLPRVLTSATNNPVDEINDPYGVQDGENTVISKFLSAFSFTLDEIFTNISLINPDTAGWATNPSIVQLMAHEFGIEGTSSDITKAAKRIIREAPYIYKRKGTLSGLNSYVEAITGFNTTITPGKNLLLSYEDSTFAIPDWSDGVLNSEPADEVGGWSTESTGIVLSVEAGATVPTGVTKSLDESFSCKAVVSSANKTMQVGTDSPVLFGIPVTAGLAYSLSAYTKRDSEAGTHSIRYHINWYAKDGSFISQSTVGTDAVVTTSWERSSFENVVAPAKAVYSGITIEFLNTGTYYLDMVQFEQSATVTAYEEPRSVTVFLNPYKTNLFPNPSFEGDLTGWTASGTSYHETVVDQFAWSGNYNVILTSDHSSQMGLTSDYIDVVPGNQYYPYMYVKDFNTSSPFVASVKFYDATNTLVGTTVVGDDTAVSAGSWTRVGVGITVPVIKNVDGTIKPIKAKASFLSKEAPSAGKSAYFDAAVFAEGTGPVSFFDGSFQDRGCAWAGTPNNSVSYFYPNRSSKLDRLASTIRFMIPLQTPYYIDAYGIDYLEGTFSGIS